MRQHAYMRCRLHYVRRNRLVRSGRDMPIDVYLSGFNDLPQHYVRRCLDLSRFPDLPGQLQLRRQSDMRWIAYLHGHLDVSRYCVMRAASHVRWHGHMLGDTIVRGLGADLRRTIHMRGIDNLYRYQYMSGNGDVHRCRDMYSHQNLRADLDMSGQPDL